MGEQYLGVHMEKLVSDKERKQRASHPIFLYDPDVHSSSEDITRLSQIVNIYDHNIYDFELNCKKIVRHYKKHYGDMSIGLFTLGQGITFRVYKGQKPIQLSLFKFLINYSMLVMPIVLGADMHDWKPWTPQKWSPSAWETQIDKYIKRCRPLGNMRKLSECISLSKYVMNLWCTYAGDRIGLSISNNDFIELTKRSDEAKQSITCTFPIPDNITPRELEQLTAKRTSDLMNFINKQKDLPISVYTNTGLFNKQQFKDFAVHIGFKPDLSGNTIPYTDDTNIFMGLKDNRGFTVDAAGGRKAEITKLKVSDAGALERSLAMLMSQNRFVDTEYECDSHHFRVREIDSLETLNKLEGRVCTLNPNSNEYLIIDPDNSDLIGKTLYIKTPITCTHPRRNEGYICSACYGKLMSNLNCDIHIGRLVAFQSADEIEQKLLSSKHTIATNTVEIEFSENFRNYFDEDNCVIRLNDDMIRASENDEVEFRHLFLEFHPKAMKKHKDGESRHYDRSIIEIVVYDDITDTREIITENSSVQFYLTPEFNNECFIGALQRSGVKDVIRIPFTDIIDHGKVLCSSVFEYQFKNNEIAEPLIKLEKILNKGSSINEFESYDDCLNSLIPLFSKGGVHLPEFQTEMIIGEMIRTLDGKRVDWREANPIYKFLSITKAIQNQKSALTSVLYQESGRQIAGDHNTYAKCGTSEYDWFLIE